MGRWSVASFGQVSWQWDKEFLVRLGSVIEHKRVEVESTADKSGLPIIEKISFGGVLSLTEPKARQGYKGRLFWADAGDLVYSKIRVKQGSLALVPAELGRIAVSAEYPVYRILETKAVPEYLSLLLKSRTFLSLFEGLSHGGSSKTRIPPDEFERQIIPLPPLAEQRAIVERWRSAQAQVAAASGRVEKLKAASSARFLTDLGLTPAAIGQMPKSFAVRWNDLATWSGSTAFKRLTVGDVHGGKFPVARGRDFLTDVCHGCSAPPSPVPTALEILKISAVTRGEFVPTEKKYAADNSRVREQFELRKDDVLLCRTNGTLGYVGMSALVLEDQQNLIFPDKVIRVRVKPELIRHDYLWLVLQTPFLRAQIEAAARTAVGNYAIGGKDIWNFEVPLPPLAVQRKLVERVTSVRAEIARERAAAAEVRQTIAAEVEALILGMKPVAKA